MRRREFIAFLCCAAVAWPRTVRAERGYRSLIPFLIDLPDWTGPDPTGTVQEGNAGRTMTAGRSYLRGDARFNVSIMSGIAARTKGNGDVHITIGRGRKSTSTIEGFQVTMQSTPVFVLIAITLGPDAILSLIFNNVSEDEAMAIARKFDWKSIQAQIN